MNDIEYIYNELKDKHKLLLTNTFSLNDGFTWDVPVIYGEVEEKRFWLYADEDVSEPHGIEFVFSVEYEKQKRFWLKKHVVKCHTHWHPRTIEQAIKDVDDFMLGKNPFIK